MPDRKRVLCIVYEAGNFPVWMKVARRGRATGEFDVVLWSPYCLPESARYQAEARDAGAVYAEEATAAGGLADIFTRLSGWFSAKPPRLPLDLHAKLTGEAPPVVAAGAPEAEALTAGLPETERTAVWRAVDRIRRRINVCEDWLVRLGVDAVAMAEDNVERDSHCWIAAARRRGIRTVVSTYGAISTQEAINAYKRSSAHAVSPARLELVRRHLPRWLVEGEDFAITRLPLHEVLARELASTAPFNPWLVNAGHSEVIALESEAMAETYRGFGFPAGQLRVIGHPMHDVIAGVARERHARRERLLAEHGLPAQRPLAVVALPPNHLAARGGEYTRFADLVAAFVRLPVEEAGVNVVVTPHPNATAEDRAIVRAAGAALVETSAADLVPLADLYVSSVSSTIKWALGCGIPVIDFDCYRYRYPDYLEQPQVLSAADEREFRAALRRFGDPVERARLTVLAQQGAARWGGIDGKALDRLVNVFFEVSTHGQI